ncbi:unnamed protein product [Lepeophtheirus salmonis]|uniref:(salmon louse) hypothetical protein n=1 Tax=Lepeophtheirus salmonis TaxID=72036 RepID=A0A7R8CUI3_LEPSM|nr:unnamed protein product [Lepeophtheirus salmonis]CAF2899103.1 unnamed protein product [Lepeophtheirus salmonis]
MKKISSSVRAKSLDKSLPSSKGNPSRIKLDKAHSYSSGSSSLLVPPTVCSYESPSSPTSPGCRSRTPSPFSFRVPKIMCKKKISNEDNSQEGSRREIGFDEEKNNSSSGENSPTRIESGKSSSVGSSLNNNVPCKCRRCSLFPLEECEPKEVSALFKFLRKSKVIFV